MSRYLNARQIRGLEKIGDAYFPGGDKFPSFSRCGCAEHVDVSLEGLPDGDRNSLKSLLTIVGFAPAFLARGLVGLAERGTHWPGPLGTGLRFLRLGLRGVVTTLYYSGETAPGYDGPSTLDGIGYKVSVFTSDVEVRGATGSVAACQGLREGRSWATNRHRK